MWSWDFKDVKCMKIRAMFRLRFAVVVCGLGCFDLIFDSRFLKTSVLNLGCRLGDGMVRCFFLVQLQQSLYILQPSEFTSCFPPIHRAKSPRRHTQTNDATDLDTSLELHCFAGCSHGTMTCAALTTTSKTNLPTLL